MNRLHYQPAGHWFGDCMPYAEDGVFWLFHQRDTRIPGPFGEPFGWDLATTRDFVNCEDRGEAIGRGGDDEQDQFIFAGSVFKGPDGYIAMYTGYNRDYPEQGRASQVLMLAESDDLVTWRKTEKSVVVPQPGYDLDDWRDPFVLWDEEAGSWLMILGGRKIEGGRIINGRTVAFRSTDLEHWDFEGDFWAPGLYTMHEMPDLFRMGDWWYLLTTEYSDKSKTVYAMSRSVTGPWAIPADDAFDGRAYYAARSAEDGGRRYLFGWVPTKEDDDGRKQWQWGGTLLVHEVVQREDGTLGVRIPDGMTAAFAAPRSLSSAALNGLAGVADVVLAEPSDGTWLLTGTLKLTEASGIVSIRLWEDATTGDGYEFRIDVANGTLRFDQRPNYPWYRYDDKGLDRPLQLRAGAEHRIRLLVDDEIATLYVDDIALTGRAYDRVGRAVVASVVGAGLELSSLELAEGLAAG